MTLIKNIMNGLLDWKNNRPVAAWLAQLSRSYRRYIFGFLTINLIAMAISLGSAVAGRYVVDAATGVHEGLYYRYIIIMLVTSLVSLLISSASNMFASFVGEKFAFGIRADLYDRVQRSVWHKLSRYRSGDLLSRLAGDVDTIAGSLISIIPNVIVSVAQLTIILFILLY